MDRKIRKRGFTLTELLIVLAILAILVAIAVPVVGGLLNKGSEKTEDVNAALYTSIMKKFAVEDVGQSSNYPRLTNNGVDSEYATFADKAGDGTYPGYNIIAGAGGADVLDEIRREAVIAIKAFSDTAVSDEYYISPPADSEYEYVYYYLTGEVKKMKRSELTTADGNDVLTGNIQIEDYWVYLSRDGGSGAALGGVGNGTGFLFIQVLQYGTGQPLDGATVTVTSGASTFAGVTQDGQNGYVGFSGIPMGSVNVHIDYPGAISFPNSSYYNKSGEIMISGSGYEGCQLNYPYVVNMKLGSLGSLGFYEERVVWENGNWVTSREKLTDSITVTSAFTANASNPGGSPRSQTYTSNLYSTGGIQQLLIGDKFLTYGNYRLSVSSYGYRTYTENVKSTVYGIDNAQGTYSGFTAPYEYPIVMRYPTGQSVVSGVIEREMTQQPQQGTVSGLSGSWGYTSNSSVYARVKLTNRSTGRSYYSAYFSYNASGKHSYTVSGLPDGTYTFEIDSPYHLDDLSEFPETVTVDGRHVEISGKVQRSDVGTGSIEGTVTYDSYGDYDPVSGATVRFKRFGDSSYAATCYTDANGNYSAEDLDCGFYQMSITLPYAMGSTTTYRKMFISNDEICDVTLSVPTVTVSGTVTPYKDGYELYVDDVLYDIEIIFQRVSGSTTYSSREASVTFDENLVYYEIELVPGYYYVNLESTCFIGLGTSKLNFRTDTERDFDLEVDDYDADNHYDLYFTSDDNGHWYECSNCYQVFDFDEHSESSWTYYSTSYCYKYCTVCGYRTTGLSAHTMSSYVSKAATCTTTGTRVHYCTRGCGYSYTSTINKSGHTGNGIWVYDNNGSASSVGTHHQNCANCGTTMNAGTACSRGSTLYSNGQTNHYDKCSTCGGRRYFDHTWTETSRTGEVCTGGTINYKCSGCGATKTGEYAASASHSWRARCNIRHSCSWDTYCTAGGQHVWDGYYHILCTRCHAVDSSKWCGIHSNVSTVIKCPY
ncbi:MAG: prepilin-type N-terminal cleavage/methylation domain-containing protein [Oscillospiraceae bacterium]|nr:prepilin-type N-terminal cleavage/methylation domain-containing protein [Oscillospiraceae bacterium]